MIPVDLLHELSINEVIARRLNAKQVARVQMTRVAGQPYSHVKLHFDGKVTRLIPVCYGATIKTYTIEPPPPHPRQGFQLTDSFPAVPLSRRIVFVIATQDMAPTVLHRFVVHANGNVESVKPYSTRRKLLIDPECDWSVVETDSIGRIRDENLPMPRWPKGTIHLHVRGERYVRAESVRANPGIRRK